MAIFESYSIGPLLKYWGLAVLCVSLAVCLNRNFQIDRNSVILIRDGYILCGIETELTCVSANLAKFQRCWLGLSAKLGNIRRRSIDSGNFMRDG